MPLLVSPAGRRRRRSLLRIRRPAPRAERPSSEAGEGRSARGGGHAVDRYQDKTRVRPLTRGGGMTAHQYSGRGGGPLAPPSSSPDEAAGRPAGGAEDWGGAAEGADGASEAEKGIGAVGAVVG